MPDAPLDLSPEDARTAVDLLAKAWQAAVDYRAFLSQRGIVRGHLEDMDLYGVLHEHEEDGHLSRPPEDVLAQVLMQDRRLDWCPPFLDPAQEIYDAAVLLLRALDVFNERWQRDVNGA